MADAGGGFASNEYLLLAFFGLSTVAFLWYMYKVVVEYQNMDPKDFLDEEDEEQEEEVELRDFTKAELAAFNGEGDAPIYLGVRGFVFDVSESKDFYGAGGSYESLAGADASLGLAAMETDPAKWPTYSSVEELSAMERETLDDWLRRFEEKYPLMGFLTDGFDGRDYDGMLAAAQAAEAAEAAGADAAGGEETALEDTPAADGVRHRGGDGDAAPVTAAAGDKAKTE